MRILMCICHILNNEYSLIFRVVTAQEEKQIKQYFRRYEDIPTGYRPDLYERWTWGKSKDTEKIMESAKIESESESDYDFNRHPPNLDECIYVTLPKL